MQPMDILITTIIKAKKHIDVNTLVIEEITGEKSLMKAKLAKMDFI